MTELSKEKTIMYFLADKRFHFQRHLLLQVIILIFASDVLFDYPSQPKFTILRCCSWLGYYLTLNIMIYSNAFIFIPRYLFTGKYIKYGLSIFIVLLISLFMLALNEAFFYVPDADDTAIYTPNIIHLIFNTLTTIFSLLLIFAGVAAFMSFRKWLEENQRADELKAATLQTELAFLKSQINPHFLFNMLNNANILIDDEPKTASRILVNLDDLLRYQMNDSMRNKVYLSADITFLKDFLELEKTRRDGFEYTISKTGDVNNIQVAPLLFIPFVENAVKHNIDSVGLSHVHLSFMVGNGKLRFTCENSIPEKETQRKVGGIGLANIKRRLDLLYKDKSTLQQTKTDNTYTVILELEL